MEHTLYTLRDLGLQAGQQRTELLELALEPYRQAGVGYAPRDEQTVPARLDISAMTEGLAFRLRLEADMHGPCARCLEDAVQHVDVDLRDVHDPRSGDPELVSDFVEGDQLDVTAMAQDAVGAQFPTRVLCREDCAGLCPSCGINRNEATCDCTLTVPDSRWEKLKELKLDGAGDAAAESD